ncbi:MULTISPECIES: hypothetical protein [unclassified Pseudomonas]|uniref:hypothetical protein n=1 Tax=unclassified Pseudomonas TaxID=196821 RepID=UPI0025803C73|nr:MULTISPECIES: hypothetical protein [unclassified Pseudomonas]
MSSTLAIPLSSLSADPHIRHAQLREYFCDKDAIAVNVGAQWILSLQWSDDPDRYVDPRLNEGLAWWGGGLKCKEMAGARKRRGKVLLSLNDTWTLESWSEWLAKQTESRDIIVLHVDDHKDLGSPRVFLQEDGWIDPIQGSAVNLAQPDSVTSAIHSGAFGMGSFLTPFLHHYPDTEVRHLCQGPKCTKTIDALIRLEVVSDCLLDPSALRPSVRLEIDKNGVGKGRYRFTDNLETWLEGVTDSNAAILLHIDMDYFCNRYDGDSDHVELPGPLNSSLPNILIRIDELTGALRRSRLTHRLADIVIAFSPGFFPAEFWADSCDRLLAGLGEAPWCDQ